MKINGVGSMGVNPYNLQAKNIENLKSAYKVKADKLEISSEAKEMQQGSVIPAERQAKVEQLKLEVENGTYALDSKSTAQGIINYYLKN